MDHPLRPHWDYKLYCQIHRSVNINTHLQLIWPFIWNHLKEMLCGYAWMWPFFGAIEPHALLLLCGNSVWSSTTYSCLHTQSPHPGRNEAPPISRFCFYFTQWTSTDDILHISDGWRRRRPHLWDVCLPFLKKNFKKEHVSLPSARRTRSSLTLAVSVPVHPDFCLYTSYL